MIIKLIIQRALAIHLLITLSLGLNLCVIESAFAGEVFANTAVTQLSNHECSHHADQESQGKSQDENQACCSNLLAVPTFLKSAFLTDLTLQSTLLPDIWAQVPHNFPRPEGDHLNGFSSDKSPPSVFLLAHFAHAPPISL